MLMSCASVSRLYRNVMNLTSVLTRRSVVAHPPIRACVDAQGGHFEHKLSRLVD